MRYPLLEFGGEGLVLHLAVANGFPPQTYRPLLQSFTEAYRVVSLPPRALWPGEPVPEMLRQWDVVADDLLAGLRQHDLSGVIAVGHSFGGVASLIAAVHEPSRFRGLCLMDPTIFPPAWLEGWERMQQDGSVRDFPLARSARRRRRTFESVEAAFQQFRGKAVFHDWPDEALRIYAETGTRPLPDGSGVELVWPPEWEVYYYCTGFTRSWALLPQLSADVPLLVMRGQHSDTFLPEAAEMLRGILPQAAVVEVAGHGHLFPLSAPQETARLIQGWLGGLA
jgi:pimeloyl-ACP methyl ester carboxylesterase